MRCSWPTSVARALGLAWTARLRVVFVHRGRARSGVTEILAWAE